MNAEIYNTAEELVGLLKEKKLLIATAESCTGGLVSSYITAVPGSSAVFELGMASYSCRIKNEALGVKKETLDTLGAVSRDTARQMAECIRKKADADIGVSVTGVAGPDSDERGNAVGTVYIGLAGPEGTLCRLRHFGKRSRERIRGQSANTAFDLLRRELQK